MAELFDIGIFSVEDTDGAVGVGWKLNFYLSGTSTRRNTYPTLADAQAATNPNANPVVSDAGGRFPPIWLVDGDYKAILTDNVDVVRVTRDPAVYSLSSELSGPDGASNIGWQQEGTGAVVRDVEGKLRDTVSVLDFIPEALHADIRAHTSTADVSAYIQAAINYLDSIDGGTLTAPRGRYYCTSEFVLCANLIVQGEGKRATVFYFTSTNGIRSTWPINSSTAAHISLRDFDIQASTTLNTGIGFWEQGGTFLSLVNVRFLGFKWNLAFDQTELAEIEKCDFEYNNVSTDAGIANVWLVNGNDLNPSSAADFTNRITITRSQFNSSNNEVIQIRDDGGNTHAARDNNYNGGKHHIWCCSATPLLIEGGEWESAADANIVLSNLSPTGATRGAPVLVSLEGAEIVSATGTDPSISIVSCSALILGKNYFSNSIATGVVAGAVNCFAIFEYMNSNPFLTPLLDGASTQLISFPYNASHMSSTGGIQVNGKNAFGYIAGAGGTISQESPKTSGVTLNAPSGQIVMAGDTLNAGVAVSFTLTNSTIAANDTVTVCIKSGATAAGYIAMVDAVAAGSCRISVRNVSAGNLSENPRLQFNVIKGSIT